MNSNIRRKIPVTGALLLAISSIMISCTKSVPYKQVYKENVESKSALSPDDEYLFVASTDLTNHDSTGTTIAEPYHQGEEKIVKFRFTENSLQVVQISDEKRLNKNNELNNNVIMEIPIQNVEYRCAQDRYGKCTNTEEENKELNWSQKTKFIPDFGNMHTTSLSVLPSDLQMLWGSSCYTETSTRFLDYKMEDGALNIRVEKNFRGIPECLGNQMYFIHSVNDLQTQAIYHYSFVKLNKLASPNYKAMDYPLKDRSTFGFFTTENRKMDTDLNYTVDNNKNWLNRWNPERKEVVYYLSDNFDKPEYKALKEASHEAFNRVNRGLKAAGVDFRLVLKDPDHKQVGDIRNSMIAMIEDPMNSGTIGFGPTVTNPRTGEILSGHVALYYGNILQYLASSYDDAVREMAQIDDTTAAADTSSAAAPATTTPATESAAPATAASAGKYILSDSINAKHKADVYSNYLLSKKTGYQISNKYLGLKNSSLAKSASKSMIAAARVDSTALAKMTGNQIYNMVNGSRSFTASKKMNTMLSVMNENNTEEENAKPQLDALSIMTKYCDYPAEYFPFGEYLKSALQSKVGKQPKLWQYLSDKEKQDVIAIIVPQIWLSTLVHELGHNLGLRHNFSGSEDKLNFYTDGELKRLGIDHAIPYSSVMDYGYSEFNVLPTLGKYDIAALRFGYKRQVETETGTLAPVPTTLEAMLKDKNSTVKPRAFEFCTDESVGLNPGCRPFDKGTSLTEMVNFQIEQYYTSYGRNNYRRNKESFSKISQGGYYYYTASSFQNIRMFMERYADLKYKLGISDDDLAWEIVPWLKDLKQAALTSGRFFINVMQEPEVLCAYAKKSDPRTIVDISALKGIDSNAANCWQVEETQDLILVGQGGRSFNDVTDKNNQYESSDQIDIRGIGADKLAAAQALFARSVGGSVQHEDNYMDVQDLAPEITSAVTSILFDQVASKVTFRDSWNNRVFATDVSYNMFWTPDVVKGGNVSHWYEVPLLPSAARRMGLPNHKVSFQEQLLKVIEGRMHSSQTHYAQDKSFVDQFRVNRIAKTSVVNAAGTEKKVDVGTYNAIALPENTVAMNAMSSMEKFNLLAKLPEKDMAALLIERDRPRNLNRGAGTPQAVQKSVVGSEYDQVTSTDISLFKAGSFPQPTLINYLLTILPDSSDVK